LKKKEFYKNRHIGKRCVLVCNGPSLNQMNLSFLKSEIVIGLNKIYLGLHKFGFYPRYYVAVNQKVITQSITDIENLTSVKFISDRIAGRLTENALTNIIATTSFRDDFSFDVTKGVQEGYTVTYAALQIAFYLGFQEVVIIGMDHRFNYQGKPNEERLLEGQDVNHFTSEYFKDQKWDNPDLVNSEKYYKIARSTFETHGRTILDATVDGACTVFKKIRYTDIFNVSPL
jgi:hypothetical protein